MSNLKIDVICARASFAGKSSPLNTEISRFHTSNSAAEAYSFIEDLLISYLEVMSADHEEIVRLLTKLKQSKTVAVNEADHLQLIFHIRDDFNTLLLSSSK